MAITQTTFVITTTGQTFGPIPGEWHADALVTNYSNSIANMASFASTETTTTGVDGETLTVTFSPRTGNKG